MVNKDQEGEKTIIRGDISYAYNKKNPKENAFLDSSLQQIDEQPEETIL